MSESDYITGTGVKREGAKWAADEDGSLILIGAPLASDKELKYPVLRGDLTEWEREVGYSVDVLVRLAGSDRPMAVGRYLYSIDAWEISGFGDRQFFNAEIGNFEAVEWWDLPESGTGKKIGVG